MIWKLNIDKVQKENIENVAKRQLSFTASEDSKSSPILVDPRNSDLYKSEEDIEVIT